MENIDQRKKYYDNKNWKLYSSLIWLGFAALNLFIIFIIGVITTKGAIIKLRSIHNITRQFTLFIILCPTMIVLMQYGKLDLSVFSLASLCSMIIALLSVNNIPGLIIFIIIFLLIIICGVINSIFSGLLNINSLIFTFCMAVLLQGITLTISQGTAIPSNNIANFRSLIIPICLFILIVIISLYICLNLFTSFGKKISPDLNNKKMIFLKRCLYIGIPFIISSIIAGIYGYFHLSYLGAAVVNSASFILIIDILLVLVLSGVILGKGNMNFIISLTASIIGGMLIVFLNYFLSFNGIRIGLQYIIKAAFFINILFYFMLFHWINKIIFNRREIKNSKEI